jgi:Na+/H+-dicarboxylate symporter
MILAILLFALIIGALASWLGKRAYHPIVTAMFVVFFIYQWVFTLIPRKESSHV